MIIELCGLPGCGKSTLVSCLTKETVGVTIITREDLYPKNKLLRYIDIKGQQLLYRFGAVQSHDPLVQNVLQQVSNGDYRYEARFIDLYKRIYRYCNSKEVLILEEGLVQYISSLAHQRRIKDYSAIKAFIKTVDNDQYFPVLCDCSIETSINRLKTRGRSGDRFVSEDAQEVYKLLEIKRDNIKNVFDCFEKTNYRLNVDVEISIEENTRRIIEWIKENTAAF